MEVRLQDSFLQKLNRQVAYISADKPGAARKFKDELIKRIKSLQYHPLKCRKSIYFDDPRIRDLIFKGYTITYKIDEALKQITVFGIVKYEEGLNE